MSTRSKPPATLERLRSEGARLMEDLSREYYMAGAGHRPTAELQAVYRRYEMVTSDDALGLAREWFLSSAVGTEERRAARMLLDWQVELASSRALAALDERAIAWESSAVVRIPPDQVLEYERASIEIANTDDRAHRLTIDRARNALIAAELAPLRQERLERERDITESLELAPDFNRTFETLSGISLGELGGQCAAFLRDTQAMWDDVHAEFVRRDLRISPREAERSDALALFRGQQFDRYFPGREMEERVLGQVSEMGVDPRAHGRVILDTEERTGKRSRAFCAPVRVPDEVYLVIRPRGGQSDWMAFLHELGHALHYGYIRADLDFEYRWLGDNSITEAFAMLFDHRLKDVGWLKRYTDLGLHTPTFLRATAFEELHMLRRYCAKLLYEIQLYGGDVPWADLPGLYADGLTAATSFRYDPANAFVDVDPRFYSARYLRAWQLQALIAESLVTQFDEDWWRNPRAGPWITGELFSEGQREDAVEMASRVAGAGGALGFAPLARAVERMLT